MSDQPPFLMLFGWAIHAPRDLVTAAALGAHGVEFVQPLLEEYPVCCRCGVELNTDNPGWHSLQTLQLGGRFAGVAMLVHCRDCAPEKLLPELAATGTWPVLSDQWKTVQGAPE